MTQDTGHSQWWMSKIKLFQDAIPCNHRAWQFSRQIELNSEYKKGHKRKQSGSGWQPFFFFFFFFLNLTVSALLHFQVHHSGGWRRTVSILLCCAFSPSASRGARYARKVPYSILKDKWCLLCTLSSSGTLSVVPKSKTPAGPTRPAPQ